jgi:hypothetical protein
MEKGKLVGFCAIFAGLLLLGLAGLAAYWFGAKDMSIRQPPPRSPHPGSFYEHSATPAPVRGLIAWWKFDETEGSIAYDSAGGHHGTLHGPKPTKGIIDGALHFDGVNDYVLVPASADLPYGSTARTITMWLFTNPSSWRNNATSPFHYGLRSRSQAFGLDMHPHPRMQFYTWEDDLVFNTNVAPEGWVHVALTYDGNRIIRAYTQGQLRGSKTLGGVLNTGFSDIQIGTFAHWYFTGSIDDVRIYDRALSAEEVRQLYQEAH